MQTDNYFVITQVFAPYPTTFQILVTSVFGQTVRDTVRSNNFVGQVGPLVTYMTDGSRDWQMGV
jgi:hypothetical protein